MPNGHPGSLISAAVYQERIFRREVHETYRKSVAGWRTRFRELLSEIAAFYPPQDDVSLDEVAGMLISTMEGGIVLAKTLLEPRTNARQIMLYRSYIKLLFRQPAHS